MSSRSAAAWIGACLALSGIGVLSSMPVRGSATAEVLRDVQAVDGWQATGVTVTAGARVDLLSVTGTWTINVAGRWFDADGYPGYFPRDIPGACGAAPLPDAQNGALIGRIGDGPPFLVGRSRAVDADRAGGLALRMNDADACRGDNGGSVTVRIAWQAAEDRPQTTTPPVAPPSPIAGTPFDPPPSTATPAGPSATEPSDPPTSAALPVPDGSAPGGATATSPRPAALPATGRAVDRSP